MTKYDFIALPLLKQVTIKKRCSKCLLPKSKLSFGKLVRGKGGLKSKCKTCDARYAAAYRKSYVGLITRIYSRQKQSCKERGDLQPSYSKSEFMDWCLGQDLFHNLYHNWSNNGYDKLSIPSVDRIDDYKSYSFDNIQLMTWLENTSKAHADAVEGRNNKRNKAVDQYSLDGFLLGCYHSISEASRVTGVPTVCISRACTKKTLSGSPQGRDTRLQSKKNGGWLYLEVYPTIK